MQEFPELTDKNRCKWANSSDLMKHYHDREWGFPVHDEQELFELLVLETMQAGLSWSTILNKREAFRKAFDNFDYQKIAQYEDMKINELLNNPGIIRNRLKINATVNNAQNFIEIQNEYGSFNQYIWSFVNNKPIHNKWKSMQDIPATTPLSDTISKNLKKKGFKFVGSTTIYATMQSMGIVNDHIVSCPLHAYLQTIE